MRWRFVQTEDVNQVLGLYQRVFGDPLVRDELDRQCNDSQLFYFLIQPEGDHNPPIGFGIFAARDTVVDFWHGGVLPESREQGVGTFLLEEAESYFADQGYTLMTVTSYNRWNIMLSMLVRRGYRVTSTEVSVKREDLKIKLQQELRPRKEIRLALTKQCNFKCFFCHNEGLEKGPGGRQPSDEEVLGVLERGIHLGCTDITFTGGEPLLKKERLRTLCQHLAERSIPPDITLVTNGYLLGKEVVDFLQRYTGALKVHVSLHAAEEETFQRITRFKKSGAFDRVKENIRRAADRGLQVKINHVVLQGYNHQTSQLERAIELARELGASTIKFLELLVVEDNAEMFSRYYDAIAIRRQVERLTSSAGESRGLRQHRFRQANDARFSIEVQRLTCQLGCLHCRQLRDRTISSDLCYHPCFVRKSRSYPITPASNLGTIFADGDRIIEGYAATFGESSPTLRFKERNVPSRMEVFFQVDNADNFIAFLKNEGLYLSGMAVFHEVYFRPRLRNESWDRFDRVLKLRWDNHDQSKVDLIYTDHSYREIKHPDLTEPLLETSTRFLSPMGPMSFDSRQEAHHLLDRLDFVMFDERDWELKFFRWPQDGGRSKSGNASGSSLEISVAASGERPTIKVPGFEDNLLDSLPLPLLNRYPGYLRPLNQPLLDYLTSPKAP